MGVLFEELKLAIQWNRPSILLGICQSKSSQIKAESALKNKLQQLGIDVVKIEVGGQSPFIFQQMLDQSNRDKVVFFISNINWGGGPDGRDTYRNLNMGREILIENRIRSVFWLTRTEALDLPGYAPDFWAFRHQVVEFSASRSGGMVKLPAGLLIWHGQTFDDVPEKLKERIEICSRSLMELPNSPEALSSRLDLLYTIGYIHWILGDAVKSLELLQSGLELAQHPQLAGLRTWLMNGMAILYHEKGEYKRASDIYSDLIAKYNDDVVLRINHGIVLSALGRNSEAISESKKAVKLSPADAGIWNRQGWIYTSAGKLDEAVPAFKRAIELAATSPIFHESLAICYYLLGLTDESINQIRNVSRYAEDRLFLAELYEEAIQGRVERSLDLLKAALVSGKIPEADLRRNFNVQIMFGSSLFEGSPL